MKNFLLVLLIGAVGSVYAQVLDPAPIEAAASGAAALTPPTTQAATAANLDTPTDVLAAPVSAHRLSAKLLFVDYGRPDAAGRSISNGIDLAYHYRLSDLITLVAPVKLGLLRVPEQPSVRQAFLGVDATAQVGQSFFDDRLRGYGMAGLGLVAEPGRGSNVQVPLGAGAAYRVTDATSVTTQVEFRPSLTPGRRNWQVGVGLLFDFGRGRYEAQYWDTDGDGVMDDVDACASIAGLARHKGCPDTDGDGIHDGADPCPLYYASPGEGGCPDRDADGVPDPDDECPDLAGELGRAGCPPPDADGDGFTDEIDACPYAPGRQLGCPDADADGIADHEDTCPKQAGPLRTQGCPDRDDDGVADMIDNCPLVPGALNGCPDRDGDGVDDGADRCPNIAGEARHDGCPAIMRSERSMFEFAVRALAFEPASAVIDEGGYANLEGLAEIMNRYPDYRVRLSGHADFEELVQDRTRLSEQRARACASFLIARGVGADRVSVEGLGAGRPIVREGTAEERAVNMRVEVDLYSE